MSSAYKLWLLACGMSHSGNRCIRDWPALATPFLLLDYLVQLQCEGLNLSYLNISCSVIFGSLLLEDFLSLKKKTEGDGCAEVEKWLVS